MSEFSEKRRVPRGRVRVPNALRISASSGEILVGLKAKKSLAT